MSWVKGELSWADGGGRLFRGERNKDEAPGWEHPMAYLEDVIDVGLMGRGGNADDTGQDQMV